MLYKVFWTTFLQAPKHCFTNDFSMILKATFGQKVIFFHFGAPDPEVGPDFLQRPSLRHPASAGSAGQKF